MLGDTATARIATPLGMIALAANDRHLLGVRIPRDSAAGQEAGEPPAHPLLARAAAQLTEWFEGARMAFDLPLSPCDSEEGERLRAGIAAVPYGETMTYGDVAALTGSVARAVGQACKTNPFPIIVPCHRVVSASGPEYYSGGAGPRTKTWLIDFEHDHLPPDKRTRLL